MSYEAIQWRKTLEKKGWRKFAGDLPRCVIEYHIIRGGWLYSGRCAAHHPLGNVADTGSQANILQRRDLNSVGVWRRARRPAGERGQTRRPAPI
ncbi:MULTISPECIES: hypothetical protein [unclassified Halomonas]|uniref:hypothetical protein n=1 Tax=unclassified Halomonas TaxID=2609666 RepID=UPI002076890B|nr:MULTISPECIES: hypothetical protein [unclassified Halomonas]